MREVDERKNMQLAPILIAGPTRCGTTMLAGLLHFHGVWIGEARITAYPQTNSLIGTENTEIKKFLKKWGGGPFHEFREQLLHHVHTDGRWLLKTVQILYNRQSFERAFPDATWLLPARPVDDIVASQILHPGMPGSRAAREKKVRWCIDQQEKVTGRRLWLDMDRMARGDEEEARKAVEFCGIEFAPEIWRDWVKPEMWHGGS